LNKTVIEDVEEAWKCVVVGEDIVIGLLGRRKWQRSLGTQHSHVFDEDLEWLVLGFLDPGKVRSREFHERVLPEKDELVTQACTVPNAREVFVETFKMPQYREIVESPRLRL
jgi:hypothetical protein